METKAQYRNKGTVLTLECDDLLMEEWEAERVYKPQKYQMVGGDILPPKTRASCERSLLQLGKIIFHQQVQALRPFSLMPSSVSSPTTTVIVPSLKPSFSLTFTPLSSSKTYTWGQWRESGGLWILVSISWTCSPHPGLKASAGMTQAWKCHW